MNVVLVMFRENGERRSFSLSREVTVIGRREDADFRIPLTDVSRKHCRLIKDGRLLLLEDLGSSNGTYHNGRGVQEAELEPGDTLRIGPVQFVIQIDGVPADHELGGHSGSGLADSASTMVTPAVPAPPPRAPPPPPPPLPPSFAMPPAAEIGQPTVDETDFEHTQNDVAFGDREMIAESRFAETPITAVDRAVSGPIDGELVEESAAAPEEVELPDGDVIEKTPSPTRPATPHAAAVDDAEYASESFEITHDSTAGEEDDVLIDFDLPEDPKH